MNTKPPNLAGETDDDIRLWNTYLYWARSSFPDIDEGLDIASPRRRIGEDEAQTLRAIVFAAFVLEYRLKRTFEVLKVELRPRTMLGPLVDCCQTRLEGASTPTGKPIKFPRNWDRVRRQLKRLVELRNAIAHANYTDVQKLRKRKRTLAREARESFNAVVDAMYILNQFAKARPWPRRRERQTLNRLRVTNSRRRLV